MGNLINAPCQVSNHSSRNVRVFVTDKPLEMDGFITSESAGVEKMLHVLPGEKKFLFREDIACTRVLASQTKEVLWQAHNFLSAFVEDENDEKFCCKKIIHNLALSAPVTVVLYDV